MPSLYLLTRILICIRSDTTTLQTRRISWKAEGARPLRPALGGGDGREVEGTGGGGEETAPARFRPQNPNFGFGVGDFEG
jgi:hypothetical protein